MSEQHIITADLIEVFITSRGGIYQSDVENCLYLNFSGKTSRLSFSSLNDLKKIIDKVDLGHMCTLIEHADIEIILIKDNCFVLSGLEIIYLKEILDGAFAMFGLNHIITDCLDRLVMS
ncbi:hypothetical protein [Daejeonella sp. JGW-45]|uniref:hypothetical protein n=1 Tax=Daejeonella sp. JGW-45 TaxID=3034148 RepID=UPI0023EB1691|nr:hypothetical protein [Daejeonella sp. JGW-45]